MDQPQCMWSQLKYWKEVYHLQTARPLRFLGIQQWKKHQLSVNNCGYLNK